MYGGTMPLKVMCNSDFAPYGQKFNEKSRLMETLENLLQN
jgi:hypothetical protein